MGSLLVKVTIFRNDKRGHGDWIILAEFSLFDVRRIDKSVWRALSLRAGHFDIWIVCCCCWRYEIIGSFAYHALARCFAWCFTLKDLLNLEIGVPWASVRREKWRLLNCSFVLALVDLALLTNPSNEWLGKLCRGEGSLLPFPLNLDWGLYVTVHAVQLWVLTLNSFANIFEVYTTFKWSLATFHEDRIKFDFGLFNRYWSLDWLPCKFPSVLSLTYRDLRMRLRRTLDGLSNWFPHSGIKEFYFV